MEVKAHLYNLRISPRKVRSVANLIRGLTVPRAQTQLQFLVRRPAFPLLKLLNSAVANASHNFKLKPENLYVSEITVNQGPTLKRALPASRGRVLPIKKRTSHVSLTLSEKKDRNQERMQQKRMQKVQPEPKAYPSAQGEAAPKKDKERPRVGPRQAKKRLTGLARRVFQKHAT